MRCIAFQKMYEIKYRLSCAYMKRGREGERYGEKR